MRGIYSIGQVILIAMFCCPILLCAQEEEESAEITTAMVEDVFQDNFFEALKQKGIGNYDKALGYLAQCKELDPGEPAVDYELGRIYLLTRQYVLAEEFLLKALQAAPSNIWYLNAVISMYMEQQDASRAVAIAGEYREYGWEQQLMLADLLIRNGEFDEASKVIDQVDRSSGSKAAAASRRLELAMINSKKAASEPSETPEEVVDKEMDADEGPDVYRKQLKALEQEARYEELLAKSIEATDNFPAQPEFYYYKSLGMLKTGDPEQALLVAEEGMAYLLDDDALEMAFYKVMKEAYTELGDEEKSKEIEKKINELNN